jgi:signal transduction histidine kinase
MEGNGRIWFGFSGGAAFLDPREEAEDQPLPMPVLERALVAGRERAHVRALDFGHRENHISLDFFVPVYFREEDLRFRSQLEGAETQPGPWRYEGYREYSGLAPGRYLLKVWVRNHAGQVSDPYTLPIHIAPALWASPVALVAYVLLLLGGIGVTVKARTRALRQRERWLQSRVGEATAALKDRERRLLDLSSQLATRNEEKNQLLGILAHDLRNPLTAILLQSELLAGTEPPEPQQGALRIARSVQALLDLLERMLDVNRIDSGVALAPLVPVDLAMATLESAARFQAAAAAKGLVLTVASGMELPRVLADADTLAAILDNLLSNAVKFSPTAPPSRTIQAGFSVASTEVAIWVQDEGPGFSAEELPRAFDRFTRLSSRPTGGESSTGLGLSIVKKLSEAMGGRVELDSRPGEGATFRLWLTRA